MGLSLLRIAELRRGIKGRRAGKEGDGPTAEPSDVITVNSVGCSILVRFVQGKEPRWSLLASRY